MSDDLPEGWASAPVGQLVEFQYGKGLPEAKRREGAVPVYGSNGVVGHHDKSVTHGPAIIIGRKGSVGAVHFSDQPCWPIDTTYFIDTAAPFDARFLVHALRQLRLAQDESSTAIPGLSRDDAYARVVPFPPLPEQRRIVAQVEALLEQVDHAKARLDRVSLLLACFRKAVLAAACGGELTGEWREDHPALHARAVPKYELPDGLELDLPEGWTWTRAKDSLLDARYGTSTKCAPDLTNGIPVLRVPNIQSGEIDLSRMKFAPRKAEKDWARLFAEEGDVLVCRTNGSLDLVGKAAVVPGLPKPHAFASYLIRLRTDRHYVRPRYLHMVLTSPIGRSQLTRDARTTAGQFNINLKILGNLALPTPPLEEQDEIVRQAGRLLDLADTIEHRLAPVVSCATSLPQAVLSKAFSGELVPTEAELARVEGRSYESAEEMLQQMGPARAAEEMGEYRTVPRRGRPTRSSGKRAR